MSPRRRWPGALLGATAVLAAGLAWPWPPVDHAPPGSIRGAAASTIRLRPPPGTVIPGLIGHWTLDEGTGTSAAAARGGPAMSATGTSGWSWTTGVRGGAVSLSGAASTPLTAATWTAVSADLSRITVAAWMRAASSGSTCTLSMRSSGSYGYFVGLYAGVWYVVPRSGSGIGYAAASASGVTSWRHLIGQWDGSAAAQADRARLWVDGAEVALARYQDALPAAIADPGSPPLSPGRDSAVGESACAIDDVWLIGGTTLTAAQRDAIRLGTAQ